jgi:hypothetical protein
MVHQALDWHDAIVISDCPHIYVSRSRNRRATFRAVTAANPRDGDDQGGWGGPRS